MASSPARAAESTGAEARARASSGTATESAYIERGIVFGQYTFRNGSDIGNRFVTRNVFIGS